MSASRKVLSVLCVLALSASAWAQAPAGAGAAATTAPAVKATPILEAVPAGSLGFVVVPNVGKTLASVDQFLKDIGVQEMLPIAGDLLTTLKSAAQLGDGFHAEGSFAAVMLDPAVYGIDLAKMMKEGGPQPGAEKPKIPFVLLVPASGLDEVFDKYERKAEGGLTLIKFRAGEAYAAMMGGYAVVSPNAKAVQDVLAAKTRAASEVAKELQAAFAGADVSVHVNLKAAGPILQAFMKMAADEAKTPANAAMPISPEQILSMYGKMLEELHGLSFTLSVGKTGVTFQEYVAFDPASPMGKAMAALKPTGSAALDRLPNLPYVLAVSSLSGANGPGDKEMMDQVLKMLSGLKEETRAKIIKLSADSQGQVTSTQFVLGGAPEGAGLFGLAAVLTCKDAAKTKAMLSETADIATEVVQSLVPGPVAVGMKIVYVKEAEKQGDLVVDAIEIQHPKLAEMDENEKAGIAAVLGDSKVRFLVASPDDKTVVLTFGGGTAMLTEALKAAKGGGTIPKDAGVIEALKALPAQPQMVMMLDAANALAVARKFAEGLGQQLPPIELTGKTPLALGGGVTGGMAQAVIFIPKDLIKDIVSVIKTFTQSHEARPVAPVRGGESF